MNFIFVYILLFSEQTEKYFYEYISLNEWMYITNKQARKANRKQSEWEWKIIAGFEIAYYHNDVCFMHEHK